HHQNAPARPRLLTGLLLYRDGIRHSARPRQVKMYCSARADPAFDLQAAIRLPDDAIHLAQSEAAALADLLRREERLDGRLSLIPSMMPFRSVLRSCRCWPRENASNCSVSLAPFSAARWAAATKRLRLPSPARRGASSSRLPMIAVSKLLKSCASPPVK